VREATQDDISFLSKGYHDLVEHIRTQTKDAYFVELKDDYARVFPKWIEKLLKHERVLVLVGCEAEKPVGFVIGILCPPFLPYSKVKCIGEITACWVEPSARLRGIGRELVERAEKWFASHGISYVEIQYIAGNSEAEGFWNSIGYEPYQVASRKRL
jgi:GNAT superfamily N-acetyltransferase